MSSPDLDTVYVPYTNVNPRRSYRQRTPAAPYQPPTMPKMKAEQQPTKRAPRSRTNVEQQLTNRAPRSRTRSKSRDPEPFDQDVVPQPLTYAQHQNAVRARSFACGVTRIPTVEEILKVSNDLVDMRWTEIKFIKEVIEKMKKQKAEPKLNQLIQTFEECLKILEWEMDPDNVRPTDLPSLDVPHTNFADISVFLIYYYDLLHENRHRITDLKSGLSMLSKQQMKELAYYEKEADKVFKRFEENVNDFNLTGDSAANYKSITEEIKKKCTVCK